MTSHAAGRNKGNDSALTSSANNTVSFADVAHQTIIFDPQEESAGLVLNLLDTPWVQRLRRIRQTGNTNLVYMFSEHSRFGHSLGVAYLANRLMKHLLRHSPNAIRLYQNAVAAAALMHDIGHVAPGSHLAERVWNPSGRTAHEDISARVILEDGAIREVLNRYSPTLAETVVKILRNDESLPPWTKQIISGGGWNADRGNWTIVDSAMASVSYGRYNVFALLDSFRLSSEGELVLLESRLDALTHFFVARDSMYRQVYQHRALQAVDSLVEMIACRLRDLLMQVGSKDHSLQRKFFATLGIIADETMLSVLSAKNYGRDLELSQVFSMTENWWSYHVERWCDCQDKILRDLASRLRDRRLFKTVRIDTDKKKGATDETLVKRAKVLAAELGFDPKYYVLDIHYADKHRGKREQAPLVALDNGSVVPVTDVEPLIGKLLERSPLSRRWIAVPKEVKEQLGRQR